MNIHSPDINAIPERDEAEAALDVLRRVGRNRDAKRKSSSLTPLWPSWFPGPPGCDYPAFTRAIPRRSRRRGLQDTLPDLQNGPSSLIRGAKQQIQHVGISNFRLPVRYQTRGQGMLTLETSVTGSVSLEADKKGINMSRIMRSFYKHADAAFSFEVIEAALDDYLVRSGQFGCAHPDAVLFPMKVDSLRSGLSGYQYYDIALELAEKTGCAKRSCILTMSIPPPAPVRWN